MSKDSLAQLKLHDFTWFNDNNMNNQSQQYSSDVSFPLTLQVDEIDNLIEAIFPLTSQNGVSKSVVESRKRVSLASLDLWSSVEEKRNFEMDFSEDNNAETNVQNTNRLQRLSVISLNLSDLEESSPTVETQNNCEFETSSSTSTPSSSARVDKPNRWSMEEETILQGVVIDCNLRFGTGASWSHIAKYYKTASAKYVQVNKLKPWQKRSDSALRKHYRTMHLRTKSSSKHPNDYWYNIYHKKWLSKEYNFGNRLIIYKGVSKKK